MILIVFSEISYSNIGRIKRHLKIHLIDVVNLSKLNLYTYEFRETVERIEKGAAQVRECRMPRLLS